MRGRKCVVCGDKVVKSDENIAVYYDREKGHILSVPDGRSGVREVVCPVCADRIPEECVFRGMEYDYDHEMIENKLVPYIKRKFQENNRYTFPTIAECARALRVRQGCIEQMVENSNGVLMLTGYGGVNERIGDLFVEILDIDG